MQTSLRRSTLYPFIALALACIATGARAELPASEVEVFELRADGQKPRSLGMLDDHPEWDALRSPPTGAAPPPSDRPPPVRGYVVLETDAVQRYLALPVLDPTGAEPELRPPAMMYTARTDGPWQTVVHVPFAVAPQPLVALGKDRFFLWGTTKKLLGDASDVRVRALVFDLSAGTIVDVDTKPCTYAPSGQWFGFGDDLLYFNPDAPGAGLCAGTPGYPMHTLALPDGAHAINMMQGPNRSVLFGVKAATRHGRTLALVLGVLALIAAMIALRSRMRRKPEPNARA